MTTSSVYDSVADFIASLDPEKVLELRPDSKMQERLEELIKKEKANGLTKSEKDELDHFIVLERLIRLAKTRANHRLNK